MNSLVLKLHQLFNSLHRFHFVNEKNVVLPSNGIYIFFEKGENYVTPEGEILDRIVRIGTHKVDGRLFERLKNHFKGSVKSSVFRKCVAECLQVKEYKNKISEKITETDISKYMQENFSFVVFEVKTKTERLKWEYKLIQTISKAVFLGEITPSEKWLGKFSPINEITKGGLWQKEGVYDEVTPQDFEDLAKIIGG